MGTVLDRVRRPEYTGENRCVPCTAVNTVIAVGASAAVGYAIWVTADGVAVAGGVGAVVFLVCVAAIYLRGYLVPGTPTLTKRYFPDRVLAWFDKAETGAATGTETAGGPDTPDIDVERELVEAGVLEEKPHGDLGLTADFAEAFREQVQRERDADADREAVADIVGIEPSDLEFEEYGDAFVAHSGGRTVGRWESRAAFLADVAAGRVLPDYYDDWADTSAAGRGQLLAGLRLFVERCPACDGQVRFGQEVVESCCRTVDVVAVTCEDCEARLFEVEASNLAAEV
ncbi:hypothetical protein BV210_01415 [Halorientalis sp. IM1011]|uniref:hypothetical protein n=1 Tax=Halorientalis sp. IM1011 TaxID=1932360 RepID=UPI00097CD41E|nr:hypothetical protein [Halorientalis sp. IM1011]AQL41453.1 hypothetical protein BV210_01415 [Halorientalis sp. IM1011]